MQRASWLALAASSAAVVVCGGVAAAQSLQPLRVGILGGDATSEPIYGQQSGIFARHGFDAQIGAYEGGAAIIAAVVGGSLDIGFSNVVSVAAAQLRGLPVVMLAPAAVYVDKTPDVWLAKARGSALRTGADLAGKTVAVTSLNGLLSVAASAWIDKNGGDAKTVHFIELPLSAMAAALKGGRIDAAMLSDPLFTQSRADVDVLGNAFGAIAPQFLVGSWVVAKTWADANLAATRRVAAAMRETARWANANHAATAQMLAAGDKLDAGTVQMMTRSTFGVDITAALLTPPLEASQRYGALKGTADVAGLVADYRHYAGA
jgi:NitT/TauT family transport system substrate-binding protein